MQLLVTLFSTTTETLESYVQNTPFFKTRR